MAERRSRTPAFGMATASSDNIGHVRPETKPIVNAEVAGRVSPKQVQIIPIPGIISPDTVPAGPEA
ncbi:hypothetical protein LCGC14_1950180 [marine sediment metagenome]|uniref:Uncharacterized protein n=1 Tax=marine sediment metagenome TaxID=412755 RepID=A0A0F9FHM8_9ZZZZ